MPDITMLQVPITYDLNDWIVSESRKLGLKKRQYVIRVLEEKMNNSPACSCQNETGDDQSYTCDCKKVIN